MNRATVVMVSLLPLAACAGSGVETPVGEGEFDRWATITDPITSREFRCFTIFRVDTNLDGKVTGGPAMFCYEPGREP